MSDTKGFGCGVWPLILTGTPFDAQCLAHDLAYMEGSKEQHTMLRAEVDRAFLVRMLAVIDLDITRTPIERAVLITQAYAFYEIASKLGRIFWEGDKYYSPLDVTGLIQRLSAYTFSLKEGNLIQEPA